MARIGKSVRRRGIPRGTSVEDIIRELVTKAKRAKQLLARRAKLASKLAALDQEIVHNCTNWDVRATSTSIVFRRRPDGRKTLREALHDLLTGKTMSVAEAAEAVKKAGYKTRSRNFRTQVNIDLAKDTDLFERVRRGLYTARELPATTGRSPNLRLVAA